MPRRESEKPKSLYDFLRKVQEAPEEKASILPRRTVFEGKGRPERKPPKESSVTSLEKATEQSRIIKQSEEYIKNEAGRRGIQEEKYKKIHEKEQELRKELTEKQQVEAEDKPVEFRRLTPKQRRRLLTEKLDQVELSTENNVKKEKIARQKRVLEKLDGFDDENDTNKRKKSKQHERIEEVKELNEDFPAEDLISVDKFDEETAAMDNLIAEEIEDYVLGDVALTPQKRQASVLKNEEDVVPVPIRDLEDYTEDELVEIEEDSRKREGLTKENLDLHIERIEQLIDVLEQEPIGINLQFDNRYRQALAMTLQIEQLGERYPDQRHEYKQMAIRMRNHINTNVARHNIYTAILSPPLSKENQALLMEGAKYLKTKGALEEAAWEYGEVKGVVAQVNKRIESLVPKIIQDANNKHQRFTFEHLGDDINTEGVLWSNLVSEIKAQYPQLSEDNVNRIVRRGIRSSAASFRLPYLIARDSHISFENLENIQALPFYEVIATWNLVEFNAMKWGIQDQHELHVLLESWGQGDHHRGHILVDKMMEDFNDVYSAGWKVPTFIEAVDNAGGYDDFALFMRYRNISLKYGEQEKKEPGIIKRKKSEMLDKIISRDTHIMPLAIIFVEDSELNHKLDFIGGLRGFQSKAADALSAKLAVELQNKRYSSDLSGLPDEHRRVLEQPETQQAIRIIQDFLYSKKQELIDGEITISSHGHSHKLPLTALQEKTLSIEDVPLDILSGDKALSSQDNYYSNVVGDLFNALALKQPAMSIFVAPENLAIMSDFSKALQALGGRPATQKITKYVVPALYELYKPNNADKIFPNLMFELFPDMSPNKISELRGTTNSIGPGEWGKLAEEWAGLGLITHQDVQQIRKITHATMMGRLPGTVGFILITTILTAGAIGIAQGIKDFNESGESKVSGSSGSHH